MFKVTVSTLRFLSILRLSHDTQISSINISSKIQNILILKSVSFSSLINDSKCTTTSIKTLCTIIRIKS